MKKSKTEHQPNQTPEARSSASSYQVGGSHYKEKTVQPWDAMQAWMSPEQFEGFLRGNVIKYVARYQDKGGIYDLHKAKHYLERLIEVLTQQP